MITREQVANKILDYLNGQMSLTQLVHWAEDAIVIFTESDERPAGADTIRDIVLYIGAADTPDFPMTWDVIKEFLERLGRPVQSILA
jgi:hypothetical protein